MRIKIIKKVQSLYKHPKVYIVLHLSFHIFSNFSLPPSPFSIQKGFTFIELILYVTIVSIIITTLTPFAWTMVQSGAKSAVQQEVYTQSRFVSERIKQEIRNATGINSVSASSISLAVSDVAKNPTIINLSGGNIRIQQGAAAAVNLNSTDTTVSSLTFTNYTSGDSLTKHIGFTFTMTDNLTSNRQEYQESITIRSSAEVRSN